MRARRAGPVVTLLATACMALALGGCAHAPGGGAPAAPAETDGSDEPAAAIAIAQPDADLLTFVTTRVTADALRQRYGTLAGSGSAAYMAAELHALGLEPAGDSGSFEQHLPADRLTSQTVAADGVGGSDDGSARPDAPRAVQPATSAEAAPVALRVTGTQGADSPVFGRDFFVHSMTGSSVSAPLVWAGVAAPARRAPGPEAGGQVLAFYLPGEEPDKTWYAALSNAIRGSVEAGAVAVLLVLDPELTDATMATLASGPADTGPITVAALRYGAAGRIFRNGLRDLDQLRNGPNVLVPVTGTTITLDAAGGAVIGEGEASRNIVAVLPGSDPVLKDTYVVFSAPIGPGTGPKAHGSAVAPTGGAPADAASSPTSAGAALLEIAAVFASLPERPARSLIFFGAAGSGGAAVQGGVVGRGADRLGSQYFAANPPVPAANIVASINIDGLLDNPKDTVAVVGQHYTSMGPLVQQIARMHANLNLAVAADLSPEDDRFLNSDSFSFARIGVPAVSFTAALPRDAAAAPGSIEAHPTIDDDAAAGLARITQFIFYFGHTLASHAERPIWTAEGRAAVQRNE